MRFSKLSALVLSTSMLTSTAFGRAVPQGSSKFKAQWDQCQALDTVVSCIENRACEWIEKESSCRINDLTARRIINEDDKTFEEKLVLGSALVAVLTFVGYFLLVYKVAQRQT